MRESPSRVWTHSSLYRFPGCRILYNGRVLRGRRVPRVCRVLRDSGVLRVKKGSPLGHKSSELLESFEIARDGDLPLGSSVGCSSPSKSFEGGLEGVLWKLW